jgi:dipeptidase D
MLDFSDFPSSEKALIFFEEFSKIPRGSGNTKAIADYLVKFAQNRGLEFYRDSSDNVIIKKPATAGYEDHPGVIIQGHTDIVALKEPGCSINMDKEGLALYRDGEYLRAKGTTLGADDGVAIAYAMAILDSSDIAHPDFEAVFTSDEEVGLIGAVALDGSQLSGRVMINVDSDVEGVFTVGCAGGLRTDMTLSTKREISSDKLYKISVSGLLGGHSGMEIDKGRLNAIKILFEILALCDSPRIFSLSGGNADNAIPRSAECVFTAENISYVLSSVLPDVLLKYRKAEADISVSLEESTLSGDVITKEDTRRIIDATLEIPSGVYSMSQEIEGLVETSSNLGIIKASENEAVISTSLRSSKNSEKEALKQKIRKIAKKHSATLSERGEYPAWEYKPKSYLSDVMKRVYERLYNKSPEIITIHAGLECGIFSEKIEGLECVSIGPDNFDIHTTEEHLSISSTVRVFEYLKEVLKEI